VRALTQLTSGSDRRLTGSALAWHGGIPGEGQTPLVCPCRDKHKIYRGNAQRLLKLATYG
jgi:hypothetical protein